MPEFVQSGWEALDLAWWQGLAAVGAVLAGGSISGLTGFGFALVIVPILLLLFPPATVVVVVTSLAVASGIPILIEDHHRIRARIVAPLMLPALVGLLVGVSILTNLDTRYIKLAAGLLVIVFATIVARGIPIPGIRSRIAPLVAGFASGTFGTSTGMAGPPVVLFLTDRTPEPRVFRASITFYFCTTNLIGLLLVINTGEVGTREFWIAAALLPVALIGRRIGQSFLHRLDQQQFRQISLGLLIATGLSAMVTALSGLL